MYDDRNMRTTIDIDDDVLQAAKEIAASRGITVGKLVSDWGRRAMAPVSVDQLRIRNGVPVLPVEPGGPRITLELVNSVRDGDEALVPGGPRE